MKSLELDKSITLEDHTIQPSTTAHHLIKALGNLLN